MKNFLLLCNVFFFSLVASSQSLEWNSPILESSGSQSTVDKAEFNSRGNACIGGTFQGNIDLDPDSLGTFNITSPPGSQSNMYFASYDEGGALLMGRHIWARSSANYGGLDVDASRNIFITGYFNDTIDLNPSANRALYQPSITGIQDAFIVKYSEQGIFLWARQLNSTSYTMPRDLAIDNVGNIIIAGSYRGTTDFDPSSGLQNRTAIDEDIFIAKYNSSGNYINAISIGAFASPVGLQEVNNVEIDASNNIYVSGKFEGQVDFDPSTSLNILTARGKNDFYIAKYNSSLQLVWVYQMGSAREEGEIDHKIYGNQLWIAGSFRDTIDLDLSTGNASYISNGGYDAFFARYNLSATVQISESFGDTGDDEILSIDVFNGDSVFISGQFEGTVDFDPSGGSKSLTASSNLSVFFASYGQMGNLNWASRVVGTGDVVTSLIRSNFKGNPYLIGNFKGSADFNDASAFSKTYTGPASFLAKYTRCGQMSFSISTQDANCGVRDGSAMANVIGGNAPLRYLWTSGHITNAADSLRAGIYYLRVIDTLNCTYHSDPIMINEIGGPNVSLTSKVDVTCNGGNDGAIVLSVSGGAIPYKFRWSNGATTQNLNTLKAGNYEVTVTDNNECKTHIRISIIEPDPIVVYPVITKPSCSLSNGSITAIVKGGSPGYTFTWLPTGTGNTINNISSGIYTVTVTDSKNCVYTESIAVSDNNAPDVYLDSLRNVSCGSGGGGIFVSVVGGSPGYNYLWSPGSFTTQDITGLSVGQYELRVTDNASCKSYFVESIHSQPSIAPDICIVDVDSITGNAVVVWEKPTNKASIAHYNIYRETSTLNVFDLIKDSIGVGELSLYEDRIADTWTRPWSYKISLTDTCGVESHLSDFHTTIHAVITKNAQQDFNVLWSPYRGNFPVLSYTCFRYTDSTGFDSVTTVPANIFSYTDVTSPSKGGEVYYYIRIDHPTGCTATEAQNRNSSRSNRGSIEPPKYLGFEKIQSFERQEDLTLYPNPANHEFYIDTDINFNGMAEVSLYNMNGSLIWIETVDGRSISQKSFGLENLTKGLYFVKIQMNDTLYTGKLMIQSE